MSKKIETVAQYAKRTKKNPKVVRRQLRDFFGKNAPKNGWKVTPAFLASL